MVLGDGILGQMMEPVVMRPMVDYRPSAKGQWMVGDSAGRERHYISSVYLAPGTLEKHNVRLLGKYREIEAKEVRYEQVDVDDADVVIVAYGTSARVAKSAAALARSQGRLKLGVLRPITLWPFPRAALREIARRKRDLLVVEMSFGQMYEDVLISACGAAKVSLLARTGGGIPGEEEIIAVAERSLKSKEPVEVYPTGE